MAEQETSTVSVGCCTVRRKRSSGAKSFVFGAMLSGTSVPSERGEVRGVSGGADGASGKTSATVAEAVLGCECGSSSNRNGGLGSAAVGATTTVRGVSPTMLPSVCQVLGTAAGALPVLTLGTSLVLDLKVLVGCVSATAGIAVG